ncbi:proton-coupled zinc antiporter SLC30A2-like isoform X2 [Plodia interpunctella]|uniref:proton-coupled zinc antiporter SLC30A2-like isoform X2 n=1 Tax=Plodia interpunctella TaxID=58824 RepID=UPI002368EFA4|nr:proton-coupled zinc antiporter SLC30A2-like isoform X2 [Plodia interpunctella]
MSSNLISEKYDSKLNGLSAFADKSFAPINGRYRSKSLSSDKFMDKLNKSNADRAAILDDVESHHITDKLETPGCLVSNSIMDQGAQPTVNCFKDGKASYGTESPARGRRVIFCVHGNPSTGCCAVIETTADGDDRRNGSISEVERHCHKSRNEEIDKRARRKLIIASVLCVIFMIGEIVGGYISNSLAIATDAAHLLTDFASFMISLFSLWVAGRPATRRMPFGWYRAEVIGALTSVLLIWVVTGVLVYMAVQRVINPDFEIDATVMLITSGVGVLVNLIMGLTLHQHGHSHGGAGHGHSHGTSNPVLNNKDRSEGSDAESASSAPHALAHAHAENINVRAAFIHVLGDFLQSFGVFIAAIVIYFKPAWVLVDPICTFLFSVLVLITTFNIIKDALLVLMEGSPRGVDFQEVANTFLSLPGVVRIHNLRMWALSLDKTALSAHLAIRTGVSPQKVLEQATRLVHEKYNFFEMTLQIEEFSDGMEQCSQCKMPQA